MCPAAHCTYLQTLCKDHDTSDLVAVCCGVVTSPARVLFHELAQILARGIPFLLRAVSDAQILSEIILVFVFQVWKSIDWYF